MNAVWTRHRADYENAENHFQKYRKLIVTGHVVELYEMDRRPYQVEKKEREEHELLTWVEDYIAEVRDRDLLEAIEVANARGAGLAEISRIISTHHGREARNITRTRNMVRRLALANFDNGSKFVTFTFAENITNVGEANAFWWQFMKKMRRKHGRFKYMAVIEFQKRGAVHYHVIWSLPYIPIRELQPIWGNGIIRINRIEHVDNVGAYIVKYMTKDLMDERFVSQKAYQCSKGLERPVELRGEEAERIMAFYELETRKAVFESHYTSEHLGNIRYQEYNLKR